MKTKKTDKLEIQYWQVCPKCKGQGCVWFPVNTPLCETFTGDGKPYKCDVCKGEKIINTKTGLPPETKQINESEQRVVRQTDRSYFE